MITRIWRGWTTPENADAVIDALGVPMYGFESMLKLITYRFGIPVSETHGLIGGILMRDDRRRLGVGKQAR